MDFAEAAASVLPSLQDIEDKVRERGYLVTATGDSESDVTIAYEDVHGTEALTIRVTTTAKKVSITKLKTFAGHIYHEADALCEGWNDDQREALSGVEAVIVYLNDQEMMNVEV